MNLAPILAATALAFSGTALAQAAPEASGGNAPPTTAPSSTDTPAAKPEAEAKGPQGFVVIQRNIYVPVDADGKATSDEVVVVDRQGYVSAEDLKAAQPEGIANGDGARKEPEADTKPEVPAKPESPGSSPAPARTPALPHGLPRDASRIAT